MTTTMLVFNISIALQQKIAIWNAKRGSDPRFFA
jgi:hypothetical protein